MKNVTIIGLVTLMQMNCFAQTVKVEGVAIDSYKRSRVKIVVNDTLSKLQEQWNDSLAYKVALNKDLVARSEDNGAFSINAKLSDSLHFSKHFFKTETYSVGDLMKNKAILIELDELPCEKYVPCKESPTDLRIFIGKKVAVNNGNDKHYCGNFFIGDSKYKSKYKVLKKYYGEVSEDTIGFVSYIHSAIVHFYEYENILVYIEKYCGENVQKKYTFFPVYLTRDGKWVLPVMSEFNTTMKISNKKPHKVRMKEPIVIPEYYRNTDYKVSYPEPYYKIVHGKVYLAQAFYPEDIITN